MVYIPKKIKYKILFYFVIRTRFRKIYFTIVVRVTYTFIV